MSSLLEGKIDFEGQKLVELIVRFVLIGSTALAFVAGYAAQSLQITFGIVAVAVVLLALIVLPAWPFLNRHPVPWLPVKKHKSQ